MQIMPTTWSYLSQRYGLGRDPFDARKNMIGGALYLAELASRYGWAGAVAAYNAGPGRYERYASGAAALPAETIAYVARIGSTATRGAMPMAPPSWRQAGLFAARAAGSATAEVSPRSHLDVERATTNALFPLAVLRSHDDESPDAR